MEEPDLQQAKACAPHGLPSTSDSIGHPTSTQPSPQGDSRLSLPFVAALESG
jgi:hypothetical protein